MHVKTMEGLVGASTNIKLANTPFRVYKEARRKGDTATMERAMGYVADFKDRAGEYQSVAEEGMEEEAREAEEREKIERENAIRKRREEYEKQEERIEESRDKNKEGDSVIISEEGGVLLQENTVAGAHEPGNAVPEQTVSVKVKTDKEPVIYTKTGEVSQVMQPVNISVSL